MPDPRSPRHAHEFVDRRTVRPPADRELAARLLASLRDGNDVRAAKVRRVRQACRDGAYENDLKVSIAAERMLSSGW